MPLKLLYDLRLPHIRNNSILNGLTVQVGTYDCMKSVVSYYPVQATRVAFWGNNMQVSWRPMFANPIPTPTIHSEGMSCLYSDRTCLTRKQQTKPGRLASISGISVLSYSSLGVGAAEPMRS